MGSPQLLLPYLALGAVCIFWGTTYVAIRIALESFPPLVLMALRFLLSGSILLVWAWWKGLAMPKGRALARTCAVGMLLLGVANTCLTFSETLIPSGLAALFLTTAPFWLVGLEALIPGGEKLTWPVTVGLAIGLCGTALLVAPGTGALEITPAVWTGFLILQIGSFCWNAGSIFQRRWKTETHPILTGALQQMAVGLVCLVLVMAIPQRPVHWSWPGVAGVAWLVTFGSIVAYSAYIYSLETLPISLVSIYTYINPVVAVALGKLFYDEPVGVKELAAMLVIFLGVGIVKRFSRPS
ncbi:MAG: EamA family transporter [Acidobacteria bacterium]|nr:EamA family transporter [Acidobacteriota bacterium]